ncbi:hypothetical protein QBC34DRAFT_302890, partial [Podospora aff. communis PSN243]
MSRTIASNNQLPYNKISIEIPRKDNEYYNQFERILNINNCNDVVDIFLIKDTNKEPSTYKQAIEGPEAEQWIHSMREEVEELIKQNTWELTPLPEGRKALGG